jgi:hypothetical protein
MILRSSTIRPSNSALDDKGRRRYRLRRKTWLPGAKLFNRLLQHRRSKTSAVAFQAGSEAFVTLGAVGVVVGKPGAAKGGETFFRTMSPAHYEKLLASGRLPGAAETFISPTRAFSESHDGVLVQFNMKPGALNALESVGVRDASALTRRTYGDMSLASKGWSSSNSYFKKEWTQINVGLGRGTALDTFNSYIQNFSVVK